VRCARASPFESAIVAPARTPAAARATSSASFIAAEEYARVKLEFRPLGQEDLRLFHEWLQRPHVARWWNERKSYEELAEHYLPSIDGTDPTELYAIVVDARDVGFIQLYLTRNEPEFAAEMGVADDVAGVDLFIAEAELLGQGLGTEVLRAFTRDLVFARHDVTACVADPDVENAASLRAFEKAGYRRVGEFLASDDGRLHAVVRVERTSIIEA
jgi:RimJ/RimL family protein N-acetyltransferase